MVTSQDLSCGFCTRYSCFTHFWWGAFVKTSFFDYMQWR